MPTQSRKTILLVTDQQNSVLNAVDANTHCAIAYTPYGDSPPGDDLRSKLRFNGELQELITGYYPLGNGYRMYSPKLMRFISPDSYAFSPFGRGGMNAYAYCEADPVNRNDPSGHFWGIGRFFKSIFRNSGKAGINITPTPINTKPYDILKSRGYITHGSESPINATSGAATEILNRGISTQAIQKTSKHLPATEATPAWKKHGYASKEVFDRQFMNAPRLDSKGQLIKPQGQPANSTAEIPTTNYHAPEPTTYSNPRRANELIKKLGRLESNAIQARHYDPYTLSYYNQKHKYTSELNSLIRKQ